jgi:cytochrome P450
MWRNELHHGNGVGSKALRSGRERNQSGRAPVALVSRFALPVPQFVDADRSVTAQDPRDYWRELQAGSVFRDLSGYFLLTRREDVAAALRDYATFSSHRKPLTTPGAAVKSLPIPVPIAYDPPAHSRFRRILQPYFSSRAADDLLPLLRRQALALINAVAPDGGCEAISDIADPFPFGVLVSLCGLPSEDRDKLAALADVNWDTPGSPPGSELFNYLAEAISSDQRPALATKLLTGDDPLTEEDVIAFYALLCLAQDGMQGGIGSALLRLARNPQLRSLLRDNPDQIGAFAEEIVRLETPLPFIGRFTTKAVTIAGVTIPAGSVVRLCLASTNLDGTEKPSVNVTDDGEIRPTPHWGFGGGVHRCLGAALARMELTVIVAEWLRAVPDFELEPDFAPSFTFTQGGAIKPSSLPLRWGQPRS